MEERRSGVGKHSQAQKGSGKYKEGNPQAADKSEPNSRKKMAKYKGKKVKKPAVATAQKGKKKGKRGEGKASSGYKKHKRRESLSSESERSEQSLEEEVKLEKDSDSAGEGK